MTESHLVPDRADVVVVGAGIAGLTAARELTKAGRHPVVIDAAQHVGGRIETVRTPYGYLENGGIFHTEQYPVYRKLLTELGLIERVAAVPTGFNSRVKTDDGWRHVNYGSLLGPVLFRGMGLRDKLVLARSALAALRRKPAGPEAFGDLLSMLDLDGRSSADVSTDRGASFFTAGPHEFLWGVESTDVSFAMLALQLHVFAGELREVRGGTGQVTDALAADLDVHLGIQVDQVEEDREGVVVRLAGGGQVNARQAVLATPADVTSELWKTAPAPVRDHLAGIEYSRIDYAYLHTSNRVEITHRGRPLSMEVVPTASRGDSTLGGIYQANDWVTEGGLLLVTAARAAHAGDIPDVELLDRLHADAEALHPELAGQVLDRQLVRHPRYTPTFRAGTVTRLAAARAALPAGPIALAGDHMAAPWVEGAVRSGQIAAEGLARARA